MLSRIMQPGASILFSLNNFKIRPPESLLDRGIQPKIQMYVLGLIYQKITYLQNKIISKDFCVMQHISYSQTVRLLWTVKVKGTKSVSVLGRIVILERIRIPNSICFAIWNEYEYQILFVNTETIRIYSNSVKYSNMNTNSVNNCNIGILRCFYNGIWLFYTRHIVFGLLLTCS